jgi:hypothetical protein
LRVRESSSSAGQSGCHLGTGHQPSGSRCAHSLVTLARSAAAWVARAPWSRRWPGTTRANRTGTCTRSASTPGRRAVAWPAPCSGLGGALRHQRSRRLPGIEQVAQCPALRTFRLRDNGNAVDAQGRSRVHRHVARRYSPGAAPRPHARPTKQVEDPAGGIVSRQAIARAHLGRKRTRLATKRPPSAMVVRRMRTPRWNSMPRK